ncbi:hypothetical protein ScalyP_jg10892, partial [Parmales sp. scaly parma]
MASCRKRNRYFFALFLAIILVTLLQLHSLVHADHNNFSFFSSKLHSTSNSYSTLSSFPNKGIILDPQQSAQLRSLFLNLKDLEKTKGRQEKEEKALALRKQMAERVRSLPSFSQENIRTNSNSSIDEYGSVSNNNNTDVPLQNVVVDNVHVIPDEHKAPILPAYWINLDRSTDRKQKMESMFSSIPSVDKLRITRVPAENADGVESKNVKIPGVQVLSKSSKNDNLKNYERHRRNLYNANEVACTLSHLKAINLAYQSGDETALIL